MLQQQQRRSRRPLIVFVVLILLGGYAYHALYRPLPSLNPQQLTATLRVGSGTSRLTWPTVGQSAVAVSSTNVLETHGTQSPAAIASVAKVITALTVLQKMPLSAGETGPTYTITTADAQRYHDYVDGDGSVVPVNVGEQLTERQMLEAIMLPSANNLADTLAVWAYGSLPAYRTAATAYLGSLGLHDTTVGSDASGYSPDTMSTAHDLALIGKAAIEHPVLRSIVGQATAEIPVAGTVNNVNFLLGTSNIIGIKTGNTDQAGGVFLSASTTVVGGRTTTLITALIGAPTLYQAMKYSLPLLTSAQANFNQTTLLAKSAVVGEYRQPWGGVLSVATQSQLDATTWRGSGTISTTIKLRPISADAGKGQIVGTATGPSSSLRGDGERTNLILLDAPTAPSKLWRLLHPF
ncbi:MAG: hypothetical protein ABIV43_01100 [Candidatus Saccharimonadales bacterium]